MRAPPFHALSDAELIDALHGIAPLASDLSDLLVEMWKRELPEAERYGHKLMAGNLGGNLNRHPDARLYDVLEVMCGCFNRPLNAQDWLALASAHEQRILDTLMIIAVRRDLRMGYEVLDLAEQQGDYNVISKALLSVVRSVPVSESNLSECLMRWAQDRAVMPNTRVAVFRRLSELPRSEKVEDFVIRCHIEDDGGDAAVTDAINDVFKQHR